MSGTCNVRIMVPIDDNTRPGHYDIHLPAKMKEIYELNLNRPEPVCIYSSDTVIPELLYADGKLFFTESEQALKRLNPDTGEVRTLAANENFSGFIEESG